MEDLYGIYRGLVHVKGSAVGIGEISLVVDADAVTMSVATGQKVEIKRMAWSELQQVLLKNVLVTYLARGNDLGAISVRCFTQSSDNAGIMIIFQKYNDFLDGVVLDGFLGTGIFGPAALYPSLSVKFGDFDRALERLQAKSGRAIPSLKNGGRAPRDG